MVNILHDKTTMIFLTYNIKVFISHNFDGILINRFGETEIYVAAQNRVYNISDILFKCIRKRK